MTLAIHQEHFVPIFFDHRQVEKVLIFMGRVACVMSMKRNARGYESQFSYLYFNKHGEVITRYNGDYFFKDAPEGSCGAGVQPLR